MSMSIDELNKFMQEHGFCNTNNEEDLPKKYVADLVESALKAGRNKAIDEFEKTATRKFTEFDLQHGYPTVADCKIILRDLAEQMKGESYEAGT